MKLLCWNPVPVPVLSSPDGSYTLRSPGQLFPLTRHLSYWLTPLIYRLPISPNQVTMLSLLAGLAGAWCFSFGDPLWGITGGLLVVMCYTLDNCDGEIARLKNMVSDWGARFDDMADWLSDSAFFVGLGYGTWQATDETFWFWFGLAAAAGASIDYAIDTIMFTRTNNKPEAKSGDEKATEENPTGENPTGGHRPKDTVDRLIYIFHKLSRADFCVIVLGLALFDLTWVLLPLAAIGAQAYWITDLFRKALGWRT